MFLFGVEFVFLSYAGTRLYETFGNPKPCTETNETENPEEHVNKTESLPVKTHADRVLEDKTSRAKNLHYLKTSGATLGLAMLSRSHPIFLPFTLLGFTYSAIPYLRIIEHSVFTKKKVDGYVLYGIADFMTLGLGRIATASLAVGLVHTAHFVISNAQESSKNSLVSVFSCQPRHVWLLKDGTEVEMPLEQVASGDIVMVHTGDVIPVDGSVIKGLASVDQHTLTGESQPAEKAMGDTVFASTVVLSGQLQIQVSKSGQETTVAKISDLLEHSLDFKTQTQLKGEQWADSWNLPVLGLAFAALPFMGPVATVVILNGHIAQNIRVVAPLSTLNYLNIASHQGILIKDGRVLEDLHDVEVFLFDKTGTLTSEEPEVGRILTYADYDADEILTYAAAAEQKLAHPIARAIINRAQAAELVLPEVEDNSYEIGLGVSVTIGDKRIRVGSRRFIQQEGIELPASLDEELSYAHDAGHSVILLAIDQQLAGVLEMHAAMRPEIPSLLTSLRHSNDDVHLAIVSGDHQQPTQKLAEKLGMDAYYYDVMPRSKAEIVEQLQAEGKKVCFIGDGVNDAIAMKKANISISLSGATSVATDTAQIVLMDGTLHHLPTLLELAAELNRNLDRGWVFNIIPGTLTIAGAFLLNINILAALTLSQGGLGLGTANAMLPLQRLKQEEKDNEPDTTS